MDGYIAVTHKECEKIALYIDPRVLAYGNSITAEHVIWPDGGKAYSCERLICKACGVPIVIMLDKPYLSAYARTSIGIVGSECDGIR